MKSRWWLNLILLIAVISLGTWAYLKSKPPAKIEYALSQLRSSDINVIRIEKINAAPVMLEKKESQWNITAPFTARADPVKIQILMSLLGLKSNHRFALTDLNRFDLDKPELKITFNQQIYSLGTINPLTMERYIATNDAVFLVSLPFGSEIAAQPYAFASKQLLGENEKPTSFQLSQFNLALIDNRWSLKPPVKEISQDSLNRWIEQWRFTPAQLTELGKPGVGLEEIKIKLDTGKIISFIVKQKNPAIVLLRQDENIQYSFSKESGEKLLQAPDAGF